MIIVLQTMFVRIVISVIMIVIIIIIMITIIIDQQGFAKAKA